jgi:hypothetical protein
MVITPAGSFAHADWRNAGVQNGFYITGDYTSPDLLSGTSCVSAKDNWVRGVVNGFSLDQITDSVFFNNRVKWTTGDSFDRYSSHRVLLIHNYASDSTQPWDHIDAIQNAESNGAQTAIWYNNADVDNELIQQTDQTNPFPPTWQGINDTDGVWWGQYIANNVVYATTNGVNTSGEFNVVANNANFGSSLGVSYQRKAAVTPVNSLMANNLANGVTRGVSPAAGYCNTSGGDGVTIYTNINIPFVPIGRAGNSGTYCTLANQPASDGNAGVYSGLNTWTQTDWRTQQGGGVDPLLIDYDALGWPALPPAAGGNLWYSQDLFGCVNLTVVGVECPGGAAGDFNARPNSSFTPTVLTSFQGNQGVANNLATSGTIGDQWILTVPSFCSNGAPICGTQYVLQEFPAGVYTRVSASTTMAGYGATMAFTLTGSGFGATQGSGTATVGGVASTISTWSDTQITGTLGASAPSIEFTLTGTGYGSSSGSVAINGSGVNLTAWNNTTISGVMPAGTPFPTAGNTVINLSGGGTGTFGSAAINAAVTPNGGGSGTITTAGVTLVSNSVPYTPGIIEAGTALGSQMPITTHGGLAWTSTPNIGPY